MGLLLLGALGVGLGLFERRLAPAPAAPRPTREDLVEISKQLHQAKRKLQAAGHHEAAEDLTEAGLLVWQAISDASRAARREEMAS